MAPWHVVALLVGWGFLLGVVFTLTLQHLRRDRRGRHRS
jgi:hypothetical protein